MIKMVVSDVDDTLLRKKLTTELKDAVKAANQSGIEFVLCSGRPTINLRRLATEFNDHGANINYVAGFNGSEIVDLKADRVISSRGFSDDEIEELVANLKSLSIDYGLYAGEHVVTNNIENEYAIFEAELNGLGVKQHDDVIASNKVLGFSVPEETEAKIASLKTIYPDLQINKSKPFFIEITKPGVNKALTVKTLSEKLNVDLINCAVCGDGDNDLAMFELPVGQKYVVANGSENLKKHAHKIIASVDEDGVAKQLMELI